MPFTKALKGKKTNFEAPDIGIKPIRSATFKRLCTDCKFYISSRKYCPIVGNVSNPNSAYCSWWKNKNEI